VREVADRILEIEAHGIRDFHGGYDEYVAACGDDHLDVGAVSMRELRARSIEVRPRPVAPARAKEKLPRSGGGPDGKARRRRAVVLSAERDRLLGEIEQAETHLAEIHQRFADPSFYADTGHADVRALKDEEGEAAGRVERLLEEWGAVERELARLEEEPAGSDSV
jgi:hypothetical protein